MFQVANQIVSVVVQVPSQKKEHRSGNAKAAVYLVAESKKACCRMPWAVLHDLVEFSLANSVTAFHPLFTEGTIRWT